MSWIKGCRQICSQVCKPFWLLGVLSMVLGFGNNLHAQDFTMAFGKDPKKDPQHLFYEKVYSKAFQKLGYNFKYIVCPSKRCSYMAEAGRVDGEPQRIKDYGQRFKNLVRVDEPIFTNRTLAFSLKTDLSVDSLQSLKGLNVRVDYIRGSVWSRENLSKVVPKENLFVVDTIKQGLKGLEYKRVDLLVALEAPSLKILYTNEFQGSGIRSVGTIGQNDSFPFVHISHQKIADRLSQILKNMKQTGEYAKILRDTMPYLRNQNY